MLERLKELWKDLPNLFFVPTIDRSLIVVGGRAAARDVDHALVH